MPTSELDQQLTTLVDASAPPVTVGEIRARARRHTRSRALAVTAVVLIGLGGATAIARAAAHAPDQRVRVSATTTTTPAPERPALGKPFGRLEIDAIGLKVIIVEGVDVNDLKRGPGHDPRSAVPGDPGTVVISGHRTTYLHPFFALDELRAGDRIELSTIRGSFFYVVTDSTVVRPKQVDATIADSGAALALVTYTPRYTVSYRLVVFARAG